ncbi:hypothetical protein Acsp01_27530 [Actinoplanes sp. NBRC 101535]|nr:hypothetical protein Acsp01_27530 [Actinoplanes sp. NBRC 101535]
MFLIPIAAIAGWGVISPRSQWRVLESWAYRDPEANEPSEGAFVMRWIVQFVILAVVVWLVVDISRTDDPRSAANSTSAPTSTASAAEQILEDFDVEAATVVMAPEVTEAPEQAQEVKIVEYKEITGAAPPAYVAQEFAGKSGSWLILGVRADKPPTAVRVNEIQKSIVFASVTTGCDAPCPTATVTSGETFYLVPVQLRRPLGHRHVWNGELPVGA